MDAPILSEEWQVYPFGIATFLAMFIFKHTNSYVLRYHLR